MNKGTPNMAVPKLKQISHWLLTRAAWVQAQASPHGDL
jgi:hypothetical protein